MKSVSGKKVEKLWQKSVDVKNINRFVHMAKLACYLLEGDQPDPGVAVAMEALENRFTIPPELLQEMTYRLSVSLAAEERHDESIEILQSILWQFADYDEFAWEPLLLWQLAESQEISGMESASESYEAAGDSYLKAQNFMFGSDLWFHAAQAASEFGNHERAKSLAIKAIDLRREKLLIKKLPNDFLKMADILTIANHLKMAIQYLEASLTLAEHLRKWDFVQRVRFQLGETNLRTGEVSTALYHFEAASHEMETQAQTHYAIKAIKECRKIYISQDRDFDAYQMDQLLNSIVE